MLGRDSVRLLALLICLVIHFGSVVPHPAPEVTTFFWRRGFIEPTSFIESTMSVWQRLSNMMAASALDKLETFDPRAETFERYVRRVKIYFEANGIVAERKKYVFLNSLGRTHFNLLANLVAPEEPETKSFDSLVATLTSHFQPKSSIIAERYKLSCRRQGPEESISDFVADLRKLIVPCNYDSAFQDTVLRDTFVSGLAHESTRRRLLTEKDDITFTRAAEIASSLETASAQARQMQDKSLSVHSVHRVSERRSTHSRTSPIVCHRCGGSHIATVCRFVEVKCWACGKTGHIAKVCCSKATTPVHSKFKKSDRTHAVVDSPQPVPSSDTTSSSDVQFLSYTLFPVISTFQPIMVSVQANGRALRMELDTGAAVSIISEDTFKSVFKDSVSILSVGRTAAVADLITNHSDLKVLGCEICQSNRSPTEAPLHQTTPGLSPAQLLMGRRLRTHLNQPDPLEWSDPGPDSLETPEEPVTI